MTAINLAVQRKAGRAYILSDGAHTDPAGRMMANSCKVIHGTKFPWAFGLTGNVDINLLFEGICDANPRNARQLIEALPKALLTAQTRAAELANKPIHQMVVQVTGAVYIAKRRQLHGLFASSVPSALSLPGLTTEAFTVYTLDSFVQSDHQGGVAGILGREADLTDPASFDPETDGIAMMRALRRLPYRATVPGFSNDVCRIGGDIDMTVVSKRGVQVWKIHEFGDRLGERIDPNG